MQRRLKFSLVCPERLCPQLRTRLWISLQDLNLKKAEGVPRSTSGSQDCGRQQWRGELSRRKTPSWGPSMPPGNHHFQELGWRCPERGTEPSYFSWPESLMKLLCPTCSLIFPSNLPTQTWCGERVTSVPARKVVIPRDAPRRVPLRVSLCSRFVSDVRGR